MPNELPSNIPNDFAILHTQRILASYKKWMGRDLLEPSHLPAQGRLFYAPFVVVTSNNAPDPILNYGNQASLDLWEMSWETLTQTPGRHTAEPMHRDERQKFLDAVQKNGFVDNYSGIRISSSGKRFEIKNAIVWNLVNESGDFIGQAATFSNWHYL